MSEWQIEFYTAYPNVRVRFTVNAETYDEAISKATEAVDKLRLTACYRNRTL